MYTVPKLDELLASSDLESSLEERVLELRKALAEERDHVLSEQQRPDLDIVQKGETFDQFRNRWRSRKSGIEKQLAELLEAVPSERKPVVGRFVNKCKAFITVAVEEAEKEASWSRYLKPRSSALGTDKLDVTLPGIRRALGAEHPVLRTMNEIVAVFRAMGYSVGEGPEIESDYYNFEALNFPPNHPARDSQDTLFVAGQEQKPLRERLLLRTHTSPMQIRVMEKQPPPVRIVVPGKVYRHDTPDASHSPLFHQVEGFAVDTNITFSDLKGTLDHAMKALFGSSVKTRFFPSFFPFTEPSADVAVTCFKCNGQGRVGETPCRVCKMSGWIELLGSGMVNPAVFGFVKSNGYDPEKISGFAFGMGVDRIAMMKYEIDDISLLFQGDVRFLEQFA